MNRWIGRMRYFLGDAIDEWRHSPGVNLLAAAILAMALCVAGWALLLLSNVAGWADQLRREAPIQVYLIDGIPAADRDALRDEIAATAGVARVDYVDQDEALRRFRASFGDLADLAADLDANPLPASFEAFVSGGADGAAAPERLSAALRGRSGVEEVRHDRAWVDRVEGMLRSARAGGGAIAVLVFGAVAFVMAGVLRLAVYARREEIQIMLLVGASPAFVRGPFLVAGVFHGLVASGAAATLVEAARRGLLGWLTAAPGSLVHLLAGRPLTPGGIALLTATGVAVSVVGALLAVRRFE